MKKIEHAIVHALIPYPKFINVVSQIIGLRASQLVPQISKLLDSPSAFNLHFFGKAIESLKDRDAVVVFFVEDYSGFRHTLLRFHCSQYCEQT